MTVASAEPHAAFFPAWIKRRNDLTGLVSPLADRERLLLAALLALGLMLRLAQIPDLVIHHPDEIFQYLEQAHRLVFGTGAIPWEYRYGMRSWLPPLLLAGPMQLGEWLAPGTALYLDLCRATMALLSLTIVISAYGIGRRISAALGLLMAGIASVWPEFVHFAPHTLSEVAAIAVAMPAIALLLPPPRGDERERVSRPAGTMVAAGALLGLACLFRFHYGVALAVLVLMTVRGREWRPLLAGGAAAAIAGAGVDLAMGETPFRWIVENVRQNVVHDRAADFGVHPPYAYFQGMFEAWHVWAPPLLALAWLGARRWPVLAAVAIANLAVHMAIGHKEYRFVLLTTTLVVLLAAVGTGEALRLARARWQDERRLWPVAVVGWALAAVSIGLSGRAAVFDRLYGPEYPLYATLRADAGMCGLGSLNAGYAAGGGYVTLHRNVPILSYSAREEAALLREQRAFNRLIIPVMPGLRAPPGYRRGPCRMGTPGIPAACIWSRPGGCEQLRSNHEANRVLARLGQ